MLPLPTGEGVIRRIVQWTAPQRYSVQSSLWRFGTGKTFAQEQRFGQFHQLRTINAPARRNTTEVQVADSAGDGDSRQVEFISLQRTVVEVAFQRVETAADFSR